MEFVKSLDIALEKWSLLKHPFYQAWNDGTLSKEVLGLYATEYYHHVAAFPRYISQIHTLCEDISARQVLLGNLIEEEQGEKNHPQLWLNFMEGLNNSREHAKVPKLDPTQKLVDGFFELTKTDYPTGLGALYAYERQTPAVSKSKIEGLIKHYDIQDERILEFFVVHEKADEWHTQELVQLIVQLNPTEQKKVYEGALQGAELLWGFLDGISLSRSFNIIAC